MLSPQSLAEWILSLAMPLGRAQATVGDLMETAGGQFGFWVQIARTAAAFTWRGATANWRELVLDAVVSWCVWGVVVVLIDLAADWWQFNPLLQSYYFAGRVRHIWITDGSLRWWGWALWLNSMTDRRLAGMAISAPLYALLSSLTGVAFVAPSLLGAVGWFGAAYVRRLVRGRRLANG